MKDPKELSEGKNSSARYIKNREVKMRLKRRHNFMRIKRMSAVLFACCCLVMTMACAPKDQRRDAYLVLRVYRNHENYWFTATENQKEKTIFFNKDQYWSFYGSLAFELNGKEETYANTKNAVSISCLYRRTEDEDYTSVTEVHWTGDYIIEGEIPSDHDYCKPFSVRLIIHVLPNTEEN